MAKFHFVALNQQGKKVIGNLESDSLEAAREALKNNGFVIQHLDPVTEETSAAESDSEVLAMVFVGTNPRGKKTKGTIRTKSPYDAYKKLTENYELTIENLYPEGADAAGIEAAKQELVELQQRHESDQRSAAKKEQKKNQNSDEFELQSVVNASQKEIGFMNEQVDRMYKDVTQLLEEHASHLDTDRVRNIREKLDLLARLRRSNSVGHLEEITNRILSEMRDEALIIQDSGLSEEERSKLQQNLNGYVAGFNKVLSEGLLKIRSIEISVDSEKIKRHLRRVKPLTVVLQTLFLVMVSILLLSVSFWIWVFVQYLAQESGEMLYFLHSAPLWYLSSFSSLMCFLIAGSFYFVEKSWRSALSYTGAGALALVVWMVQFPAIFYWV